MANFLQFDMPGNPPPDPREQAVVSLETVRAAKIAHNRERLEAGYAPDLPVETRVEHLTEDQLAVLDAQDAIERLADRLGSYARLVCIAKSLAWIHGEDV